MADLDGDQSTVSGRPEEPGDLEPAQAELPRDLDPGALIEVVPGAPPRLRVPDPRVRLVSGHMSPSARLSVGRPLCKRPLDGASTTSDTGGERARTGSYEVDGPSRTFDARRRRCLASSPPRPTRCLRWWHPGHGDPVAHRSWAV